ncbi:hypothetical protein SAMN05444161_8468 [Rhizobiales bacterium GAS191]|nr:hypothetical protein SAMN05444161_8468 [Rhizobiales bacterium GAS191]
MAGVQHRLHHLSGLTFMHCEDPDYNQLVFERGFVSMVFKRGEGV